MKCFLLLLLFISTNIFAQYEPRFDTRIETPFNSFTKLPSVEWAVRANDTLVCLKPDISKILVDKIMKSKILTSYFFDFDSKEELKIKFTTKNQNMQILLDDALIEPLFDSDGNLVENSIKKRVDNKRDIIKGSIRFYEKLYISEGNLSSYISHVAILANAMTPGGTYLGEADLINTAFNKKYNYSPSQKDKTFYLTKTQREFFVDSIKKGNKYKETFGRNMVETLWPYVLANKLKVYSVVTGKLLNPKDINSELIGNPTLIIPTYDSEGNATTKKLEKYQLYPQIFPKVIIKQTWYYNDTRNIFFNKIPEIILYSKLSGEEELKPVLKISFTK